MECRELLAYGENGWDDFCVVEEYDRVTGAHSYNCIIEEYIYYNSLDKAIDYYEDMRLFFLEWLMNNNRDHIFEYNIERFDDIKLDKKEGIGVAVYTDCPNYIHIEQVYLWLVDVINQLEEINTHGGK